MSLADIVVLFFCGAAIIAPRLLLRVRPSINSGIIIGGLFVFSIAGGLVYKWMTGDSGTPAFSRIFFVAGLSHLIIFAVYQEVYRRMEIRQMQLDHEEELAQGKSVQH